MKIFEKEIRQLITSVYAGVITEEQTLSHFTILFLPDKKTAFHIVPVHKVTDENFFADLSGSYQKQGIRLVHLWEDFWMQKRAIMESRIRLILGDFIRIHARKTVAKRIDAPTVDAFLKENHLYGSPGSKYKYGLYYNDVLVAAASFSAIRTYWRNVDPFKSAELIRFASLNGHSVVGGLGKLLTAFIREHQPDDIMTYADRDWSNGESYEKLGFRKIENTLPQPFWIKNDTFIRY